MSGEIGIIVSQLQSSHIAILPTVTPNFPDESLLFARSAWCHVGH